MSYTVKVPGGSTYEVDHLTVDEAIAIEEQTGSTWQTINPMRSAKHAKAILAAFMARDMGPEAATAKVGAMTVEEILDAIVWVDQDSLPTEFADGMPSDPKAEEASTGGSSSGGEPSA